MNLQAWIPRRSGAQRQCRLYCFSYAGGSALTFSGWQDAVDPALEICAIQLPGRGERFHEAPHRHLGELVRTLAEVIASDSDLPFALFGHSLGGLLAFEVSRFQMAHGLALAQHVFVSGCSAPRYRSPSRGLHLLEDAALLEALAEYQGTPAELLAHRELMELVLPTIRADFSLVEDYLYAARAPLTMPVTVLAGRTDQFDSPQQVQGWAEETVAPCRIAWFDGDHFFINGQRRAVIDCIEQDLECLLRRDLV